MSNMGGPSYPVNTALGSGLGLGLGLGLSGGSGTTSVPLPLPALHHTPSRLHLSLFERTFFSDNKLGEVELDLAHVRWPSGSNDDANGGGNSSSSSSSNHRLLYRDWLPLCHAPHQVNITITHLPHLIPSVMSISTTSLLLRFLGHLLKTTHTIQYIRTNYTQHNTTQHNLSKYPNAIVIFSHVLI